MKQILVAVLTVLIFQPAFSQSKEDSIKELMKVMKQEELIEKSFNSVLPALKKQIEAQSGNTPTQNSQELFTYSMRLAAEMGKNLVNNDMVAIYSNLFTEAEITDLITFYKTPTGQKMLDAMPEMQKQLMSVMFSKYMPQMQEKIKQKALELKAKP